MFFLFLFDWRFTNLIALLKESGFGPIYIFFTIFLFSNLFISTIIFNYFLCFLTWGTIYIFFPILFRWKLVIFINCPSLLPNFQAKNLNSPWHSPPFFFSCLLSNIPGNWFVYSYYIIQYFSPISNAIVLVQSTVTTCLTYCSSF